MGAIRYKKDGVWYQVGSLGNVTPSSIVVDQTYDATSENPQSGKAVAEALTGKQDLITESTDLNVDVLTAKALNVTSTGANISNLTLTGNFTVNGKTFGFPNKGGQLVTLAYLDDLATTASVSDLAKRVATLEEILNQDGYDVVLVKK